MTTTQIDPRRLSTGTAPQGLDITVRTGAGTGRTLLSAFDNALQLAGVADFNLVTLSSVIPPGSKVRTLDAPLAGIHGDLLFCVRAEAFAEHPGDVAWAGLGWCVDETGGGLFVEHHGPSEEWVMNQIELSLADMNAKRGGGYGPVHTALTSATCVDAPVCALVLAAYRVSTWHEADAGQAAQAAQAAPTARTALTEPVHRSEVVNDAHAFAGQPAGADVSGSAARATHGHLVGDTLVPQQAPPEAEGLVVSAEAVPHVPDLKVTVEKEIDYATARQYYQLYQDTFGPMGTKAVARQLLHESEFMEEMLDGRVHKYVAWDADGRAIGMTTVTQDLDTVPWISPDYFAHHYPDHTARNAVFYLGFTLVHPGARKGHVFHAMIEPMAHMILANRGVVAYDMCRFNDQAGLGGSAGRLLKSIADITIEPIDVQTYYTGNFHGPKVPENASGT